MMPRRYSEIPRLYDRGVQSRSFQGRRWSRSAGSGERTAMFPSSLSMTTRAQPNVSPRTRVRLHGGDAEQAAQPLVPTANKEHPPQGLETAGSPARRPIRRSRSRIRRTSRLQCRCYGSAVIEIWRMDAVDTFDL